MYFEVLLFFHWKKRFEYLLISENEDVNFEFCL